MDGYFEFELDLPNALLTELVKILDSMNPLQLTPQNLVAVADEAQGVYQLLYRDRLVYIGKSDAEAGLKVRLLRHANKVLSRRNFGPADVEFKAVRVRVFAAMDLETQLIKHYKARKMTPSWNGSGFGSNDPGRERETTNKNPAGFDAQFPINIDLPLQFLTSEPQPMHQLLMTLKDNVEYCFRYEVAGKATGASYRTRPHNDYLGRTVNLPTTAPTMRQVMRLVVAALPSGWQATEFPSHVILYKENKVYQFGSPII